MTLSSLATPRGAGFQPTPDPADWTASLAIAVIVALVVAVPGSRLLLALYRARVARLMAGSAHPGDKTSGEPGPPSPSTDLQIRVLKSEEPLSEEAERLWNKMTHAARRVATVYALGGIALGSAISLLWLYWNQELDVTPMRLLALTLCFAGFAVPTISMVAIVRRWLLWLAPVPYLMVLWALSAAVGVSLVPVALIGTALPTAVALAVAGASARVAGAVLFVTLLLAVIGVVLGIDSAVGFLEANLVPASLPGAVLRVVAWSVLGLATAAAALVLLVRGYRNKSLSEQEIRVMTWWLVFTLCAILVVSPSGQSWTAFLLLLWAGYWLASRMFLSAGADKSGPRPPSLLILRVFGARHRLETLMRGIEIHWRYVGPVQLIAGTDLAAKYLEPDELVDFARGRLRSRFLAAETDVGRQVSELDLLPDPDSRYRVTEFFCTEDMWRNAVTRLISRADAVLADFRGFTAANRGAAFEIRTLLDRASLSRLVCLVDGAADLSALTETAVGHWSRLSPDSPNREVSAPVMTLLEVGHGADVDLRRVTRGLAAVARAQV